MFIIVGMMRQTSAQLSAELAAETESIEGSDVVTDFICGCKDYRTRLAAHLPTTELDLQI